MKHNIKRFGLPIVILAVLTGIVYLVLSITVATDLPTIGKKEAAVSKTTAIQLTAIGDSLTEGIGDSTGQGGFVPLVKKQIEDGYHIDVTTENNGVAGETSTQILKRIKKSPKITQGFKDAQIVTLTVGGNDLMNVFKKDALNFSQKDVNKAQKIYRKNVAAIISYIRTQNKNVPIFIFGIYNPFYVYFSNVTVLQDNVDAWNKMTQTIIDENKATYFVDINALSTGDKLQNSDVNNTSTSSKNAMKTSVQNDLIFTGDNFHPNNKGYQLMSDDLYKVIKKQQNSWYHA